MDESMDDYMDDFKAEQMMRQREMQAQMTAQNNRQVPTPPVSKQQQAMRIEDSSPQHDADEEAMAAIEGAHPS